MTSHRQAKVARLAFALASSLASTTLPSSVLVVSHYLRQRGCSFLWGSDSCLPSLLYMALSICKQLLWDAFPTGESAPKAVESGQPVPSYIR